MWSLNLVMAWLRVSWARINLMGQVLREDTLLDLLPVSREDLVSEVVIGGHHGHSNHETTELKTW